MNFKKTIAGICALAMVGTCGVSVFAEDVTTTTTDVQDETTVTTVETEEMTDASAAMTEGTTTEESVTTGVTTEATEGTTTETAVTEEDIAVKEETGRTIIDSVSFDLSEHHFKAEAWYYDESSVDGVFLRIFDESEYEYEMNWTLASKKQYQGINNYVSVENNILTIQASSGLKYLEYKNGILVNADLNNITTTTTATDTIETTTTTTVNVELAVTEEQLRKIFEDFLISNGMDIKDINRFEPVINSITGELEAYGSHKSNSSTHFYKITKDGVTENKISNSYEDIPIDHMTIELDNESFLIILRYSDFDYVNNKTTAYCDVYHLKNNGTYETTNLSNYKLWTTDIDVGRGGLAGMGITVNNSILHYCDGKDYTYNKATNTFVTGNTPVETFIDVNNGDVWEVTGTLSYETDNLGFKHAILNLDTPVNVIYHNNTGVGVADGTKETVTSVQIADEVNYAEGTRLSVKGTVMIGHTAHHLRHICLTDCFIEPIDNPAPVKPSKKNPAGTGSSPKTGENAVLPVALALTFVAGTAVVAGIKKKKK